MSLNVSSFLVNCLFRFVQHLKFCFIKVSGKILLWNFLKCSLCLFLGFKQTELLNSNIEFTIKGSKFYIAMLHVQNKVKSWRKFWLIEKNKRLDKLFANLCVCCRFLMLLFIS